MIQIQNVIAINFPIISPRPTYLHTLQQSRNGTLLNLLIRKETFVEQEILLAITTRVLNFVAKLEKEKFNSKRKEKRKSLSFVPTDFTYHSLKKKLSPEKGSAITNPLLSTIRNPVSVDWNSSMVRNKLPFEGTRVTRKRAIKRVQGRDGK